jgi:hypothetical protein
MVSVSPAPVPCTCTIVSADGIAVSTASWVASAATTSPMMVWETSGRTASWNSTLHSADPSASSARLVDSLRVSPPSTIWLTLP